MTFFRLNASSGVPLYVQLMEQVKHAVETGALRPGDQLPTIRALAQELVMNSNTVVRAYRELELAGVLEKRGTTGTFVSNAVTPVARRERLRILTERVDALVVEAQHLGVGVDDVLELVRKRNNALAQGKTEDKR